jgi:competence protein ComEA
MLKKILAFVVMLYAAVAMAAAATDVNKATDAQLDAVKGIGPATSKAIMAERKKGDFKDWADFIARVKGIGDKKAEALSKEGLTVNGEAYKSAAAMKKEDKKADKKAEMKSDKKADAKKDAASAKK